jgi:hypothetical protein
MKSANCIPRRAAWLAIGAGAAATIAVSEGASITRRGRTPLEPSVTLKARRRRRRLADHEHACPAASSRRPSKLPANTFFGHYLWWACRGPRRREDAVRERRSGWQRRFVCALKCLVQQFLDPSGISSSCSSLAGVFAPPAETLDGTVRGPALEHVLRDVERAVARRGLHAQVRHSSSVGPPPPRAFSIARWPRGNGDTSLPSPPRLRSRGLCVGSATLGRVLEVGRRRVGHRLLSQTDHRSLRTPARFIASCVSPGAEAPSPNQPTATRLSSGPAARRRRREASPAGGDHREQPEPRVGHVHVAVRPGLARLPGPCTARDPPGLDPAT